MEMSAAVLEKLGSQLTFFQNIILPPLERGQVLVRIAFSGVCHSQLMEVRGARGHDRFLPHLLGHEGTGRVEVVGDGVSKVKPGDWVVLGWIKGLGIEAGGVKYAHGERQINAGGVTTFNEMAVVSENRLVLLPHGVPLDIGVLFGCALPTGAGIVINTIQPVAGSTLAVFGLGGIGMSALMATQLFNCSQVIAIDINPNKLALAKEFGATHVIDARHSGVLEQIRQMTGGVGADYSIEATGIAQSIELAFDAVRRGGGLCVFASHPAHGSRISLDPFELICGKRILGSWGGDCRPDEDIPKFAELYRQGRLPLGKLITKRYRLDQLNEALDDLEAQRVGRPLLEISPLLASQYDAGQS